MKKAILLIAAITFGFSVSNAQEDGVIGGFSKGDVYVSGSIGFNSQNSPGDSKDNAFTVMPSVGFFVSDHVALGAELGYMTYKGKLSGTTVSKINQLSAGVYGKYVFTPQKQFSFYTQLGVGITTWEDKEITDSKVNGFGVALAPGINYFISNCIALHASVGSLAYNTTKPDVDGAESTDTFGLNVNLKDINFGVIYNF